MAMLRERSTADDAMASLAGLREHDLARLWEGGHLPASALVALDGTPLQVVYRGRPNAGAGPDFRDAVLALPDGRLLHGDVELHLRAADFRRHGHARDPAYNRVVLHLVCHADDGTDTLLACGARARIVALDRWLAARAAQLRAMLEQPALWREPCQSAVSRLGAAAVQETLARLGERRLRAKAAHLAGRPPEVALYEALLRTLGHGAQEGAWLLLAHRLPLSRLAAAIEADAEAPEQDLEALLLGAAGLLPPAGAAGAAEWQRRWLAQGAPVSLPIAVAGPRRPANHPARRLAGLARLLRSGPLLLLGRLRAVLLSESRPRRPLLARLTVPAEGEWRQRLLPWDATTALDSPLPLIGAGKAVELATNAALPVLLAMAERQNDEPLARAALAALHALPAPPPYGSTAHLGRALRADAHSLITGAGRSQGTLYLAATYCSRGGCGRCPLS